MRLFTFERRVVVQQLLTGVFGGLVRVEVRLQKAQAGGRAHNLLRLSVVDRGGWIEVRARVWR